MKKVKKFLSIFGSLIVSAVLLSGCSVIPELPKENVTFVSFDGKYELTASNDWIVIPNLTAEEKKEWLFALYSNKRKIEFETLFEPHAVYSVFKYENYCNKFIKDVFCNQFDIAFPDDYSEVDVWGTKARWYEDFGVIDDQCGGKEDYFCCIAEVGEEETEKTYFVAYGFLKGLNDDIKAEILEMINSITPIIKEK